MKVTLALAAIGLASLAAGAPTAPQRGSAAPKTIEAPTEPGIAWFGTWKEGLAEAKRTKRPIFFMSAAPKCQGVPGLW